MAEWKDLMPACFGLVDRKFALHAMERANARVMLAAAWRAGALWAEVETAARDFLIGKGAPEQHIQEQLRVMARTESYFDD